MIILKSISYLLCRVLSLFNKNKSVLKKRSTSYIVRCRNQRCIKHVCCAVCCHIWMSVTANETIITGAFLMFHLYFDHQSICNFNNWVFLVNTAIRFSTQIFLSLKIYKSSFCRHRKTTETAMMKQCSYFRWSRECTHLLSMVPRHIMYVFVDRIILSRFFFCSVEIYKLLFLLLIVQE